MKVRTGIKAGAGLGDTVANITHLTRLDQLANAYEEITGKPCGCSERQEKLNRIPLPGLK